MVKSRSSSSSSGGSGGGGGKSCYRGHWRPAEDDKLRQLVEQFGPQNWNFIAEHFEGRSGKSCRLRWYNQLDPNINKNPFTEEEEERLLIYQQLHGNKWALIARHFKGRTDNAVKNHYHVIMARRRRERFTIFGNKSVHQNNIISSSQTLTFPNFQNNGKKWSLLGSSSAFKPSPCWDLSVSKAAKDQKGRKDHKIMGASSTSFTAEIMNCKKNNANPFWGLSFGDGNGGKIMKMSSSVTKSNDNPVLLMNWQLGSDQKEQGSGPISDQQKGTDLPFIDFLGMGSS